MKICENLFRTAFPDISGRNNCLSKIIVKICEVVGRFFRSFKVFCCQSRKSMIGLTPKIGRDSGRCDSSKIVELSKFGSFVIQEGMFNFAEIKRQVGVDNDRNLIIKFGEGETLNYETSLEKLKIFFDKDECKSHKVLCYMNQSIFGVCTESGLQFQNLCLSYLQEWNATYTDSITFQLEITEQKVSVIGSVIRAGNLKNDSGIQIVQEVKVVFDKAGEIIDHEAYAYTRRLLQDNR